MTCGLSFTLEETKGIFTRTTAGLFHKDSTPKTGSGLQLWSDIEFHCGLVSPDKALLVSSTCTMQIHKHWPALQMSSH